jgi:RNA polymerase sigma factor (sigma-70 family)
MIVALESEMVIRKRKKQLGEIVKGESPKLFNFIKSRLPNLQDAEDILQDVLSDFSETFLLRDSIEQTSGWLYRVAKNRIADNFRKKKTTPFSMLGNEGEEHWLEQVMIIERNVEDQLWNESITEAIDDALDKLPVAQRDVFVLHEIEGYSFKEIAEITETSVATLASRKRYAIATLKKELATIYSDFTD